MSLFNLEKGRIILLLITQRLFIALGQTFLTPGETPRLTVKH